jgi:replication factor C subunit 2/4
MSSLPWTNQYTPVKINNLAIADGLINYFNDIITNKQMKTLLIVGNTGTCKTTAVECLLDEYKNDSIDSDINNIYRLNLTNNNKTTIHSSLIKFCKNPYDKIVIIDNIDKFQDRMQDIILNTMNKYESNTKFILICIDIQNIINGIQTKCNILHFDKIKDDKLKYILNEICRIEQIKLTHRDSIIDQIIINSNGDIRSAINTLQLIYCKNDTDIANISYIHGWTNTSINIKLIEYLLANDNIGLINYLRNIHPQYGGLNIIHGLKAHLLYAKSDEINETDKMELLKKITITEGELMSGTDTLIHLIDKLIN